MLRSASRWVLLMVGALLLLRWLSHCEASTLGRAVPCWVLLSVGLFLASLVFSSCPSASLLPACLSSSLMVEASTLGRCCRGSLPLMERSGALLPLPSFSPFC